jgi:transglutaminase-like putative cysteine protease
MSLSFLRRIGFTAARVGWCGVVALSVSPAYGFKDSVPDWVKAAAAEPLGIYPADTDAVVLLDDTTLTIGKDGKAVEHHRYAVKILRPSGRDQGRVYQWFDKDSKILSLHVWSIGPDGHEYQVKDNEIVEVGAAPEGGGILFEDMRAKVADPPGRDPGGVVAWETEQRLPYYEHEEDLYFEGSLPRVKQSFTLEMPPNYAYVSATAHYPPVKAIDLEHERYRWEFNDVPAIDLHRVPLAPSMGALTGRLTVHFGPAGDPHLGTWQGLGEWYDQLARDRMAATPEIAAKAAALTAGKTDFYDKTEAIAEYVQKQIRYFVIERGIGGQQPHPAADIFRMGYGDCKDKSTLLSAMLSSVGIHSAILLVDTERGIIDPDAPALVGNHAIAAVRRPDGYDSPKLRSVVTAKSGHRYLIVDPTWDKTAFGQLEHNLQGGYALLVEGKDSEVIQIPVLKPELNTVRRTAQLQLQPDGSLKGNYSEKRFGDLSEQRRDLYTNGDAKEQRTFLDRVLSRDFVSFTVSDVKVENVQAFNKDLETSFSLSAERYARPAGPLLMVRPRVIGSEGLETDKKPRKVPIDLDQTMQEKDDFTIQLPEGFTADEVPDPVKLDVGFASYESSTELKGNALHYTRTYTVRQVTLPASRYADVQKLAETIATDEQMRAVLKKKQ